MTLFLNTSNGKHYYKNIGRTVQLTLPLCFPFSIVSFGDYVEELGHPYVWVQTLGGLHFPNDSSEVGLLSPNRITSVFVHFMQRYFFFSLFPRQSARGGSSLSASQMESTMKLLRGRLLSRQALTKQFASLGRWDSIAHSCTDQRFINVRHFSSDISIRPRRRAQHHPSYQRVPAPVPSQDHVPLGPLDPHHPRGL